MHERSEFRVPNAPSYAGLPPARPRVSRRGSDIAALTVRLEVVTPILGGGTRTRELCELDAIRVPTVRGHLRFWWRALHAPRFSQSKDLYERESEIWGRAAADSGGRSPVTVRTRILQTGSVDSGDVHLQHTRGAYALWPARGQKAREAKQEIPPAPRRAPGTRFELTVLAPSDHAEDVRRSLLAWILFGGYGGRARRGLGSLTVVDAPAAWLPAAATREALASAFGVDVFAAPGTAPSDTPVLAGAALRCGVPGGNADAAWTTALDWLREFRQGTRGAAGERAREPDPSGGNRRPSIPNWPEADKIRHLLGKTRGHTPVHNAIPAWPRAGFGLPINGQFQKEGRHSGRYDEPGNFRITWRSGAKEHDRLASPLIVKALPLADGRFAPCALWLNRADPKGEVFLHGSDRSGAPFDRLVAPGDVARFAALAGKESLRDAFLDWLHAGRETEVVAP